MFDSLQWKQQDQLWLDGGCAVQSWIHSLHSCYYLLSETLVSTLGCPTTEASWHPHGRVILFTSFFSSYSVVDVLWWALIYGTKIFVTIPISPSTCLILVHDSPILISRPQTGQLSHLSLRDCIFLPWSLSSPYKMNGQVLCPKLCPLGEFLLIALFLQGQPEWHCKWVVGYYQLALVYWAGHMWTKFSFCSSSAGHEEPFHLYPY